MMMPSTSAVVMAAVPLTGVQRREAEAHDDRVGAGDADGFGEVVDAGREEQILAFGELRVDGGGGVAVGVGDVELRDEGSSCRGSIRCVPGDAGAVVLKIAGTRTL